MTDAISHRCAGADCPVCERVAEERAEERYVAGDEEHAVRRAERAYERQMLGR